MAAFIGSGKVLALPSAALAARKTQAKFRGTTMNFASDNWAGAHPDISNSLSRHAGGYAAAYGASEIDLAVESRFSEIFDHEVAVFFVATGTAANSLALASAARPGGVAFAHRDSHVIVDECGAPEFQAGLRLHPLEGAAGKFDASTLARALTLYPRGSVRTGEPCLVSITQATETGTTYGTQEMTEIASVCRKNGIPLHMDGARFANAMVGLGATPSEMTWKCGVDIVSFGGTKNGCWCAEALMFFDPERARQFPFLRKRAGHLFSKSRFVAAQFDAYFQDNLWLRLARHANEMAASLANVVTKAPRLRLAWPQQANEVFVIMPRSECDRMAKAGALFYPQAAPADIAPEMSDDEILTRFVTSFATEDAEIEKFAQITC
jgi:threonine aldolase